MNALSPQQRDELIAALHVAPRTIERKLERVKAWDAAVYWLTMFFTAVTASVFWILVVEELSTRMKWIGAAVGTISFLLALFSSRNPFGNEAELRSDLSQILAVFHTVQLKHNITREDVSLLLPNSAATPLRHLRAEERDNILKAIGRAYAV
jgi:hypothetical protein